ncbi:MAG: ribonuclease III [Propionibacteriaceae bacterium]|nr:ribonuclease III [Propionibacteriaceae bacterium]
MGISVEPHLLELAFTHRSWAYENGRVPTNERLEFLGDSVLGVVVTEYIFRTYPDRPEGQLSRLRAAVVSSHALAGVARDLELGQSIKLGHGEIATNGQDKDSILADATEAIIGAVHLSGGFEVSSRFVHAVMDPVIAEAADLGAGLDWKSSLQDLAASLGLSVPEYTSEFTGPDHDRWFRAEVVVDGRTFGPGESTSRRGAEQEAAKAAFTALDAQA